MICTCDACRYTFESDAIPVACPNCGKETVNRVVCIGERKTAYTAPSVRTATSDETDYYEKVKAGIESEENRLTALNAAQATLESLLTSVDNYEMTIDERNWSLVLLHEFHGVPAQYWYTQLQKICSCDDPDWCYQFYMDIRKEFTRAINSDRNDLKDAGISEPMFIPRYDWENDGNELPFDEMKKEIENWDQIGSALQVLYRFRDGKILSPLDTTPTLGNLRRIDLRVITEKPSRGYLQFLLDWEGRLV